MTTTLMVDGMSPAPRKAMESAKRTPTSASSLGLRPAPVARRTEQVRELREEHPLIFGESFQLDSLPSCPSE